MAELGKVPAQSAHIALIESKIPAWVLGASPETRAVLRRHSWKPEPWYERAVAANPGIGAALQASYSRLLELQLRTRTIMGRLNSIESFAAPLLADAIKVQWAVELDVTDTYLVHERLGSGRVPVGYTRQTLLQAALQNFEAWETSYVSGGFDGSSALVSGKTHAPEVRPVLRFSPQAFVRLARLLDIGGQYQAHLRAVFLPSSGLNEAPGMGAYRVSTKFAEHDKCALLVQSHLAFMKGYLSRDSYRLLLQVCSDYGGVFQDGGPLRTSYLSLWGITLRTIWVIEGLRNESAPGVPRQVMAYIPDDPLHPSLQEFTSLEAFTTTLRNRLFNPAYQRFFCRFVPVAEQARFLFKLKDNLEKQLWNAERHLYEIVPDDEARLPLKREDIYGSIFRRFAYQKIEDLIADARYLAVPTGDKDQKSFDARLQHALSDGLMALNVGAFFVPGLGEAMLLVTAVQLGYETYEGIENWSRGDTDQAWAYLSDVGENLALFGALGFAARAAKMPTRLNQAAIVERLLPVELPNGEERLWKPDMKPFAQSPELPMEIEPDALGLIEHDNRTWLAIDDQHYAVSYDKHLQKYRIQHPEKTGGYAPILDHNGAGTWRHRFEQPLEWQGLKLFRRLGYRASERVFSAAKVEQVLLASGTDEAVLRKVHVKTEPLPALLDDTMRRFEIDQQVQVFCEQMERGEPSANPSFQLQLLAADGHWPKDLRLRLVGGQAQVPGYYGPVDGSVIAVSFDDPDVLLAVTSQLKDKQMVRLLGRDAPAFGDQGNQRSVQVKVLRARLARQARQNRMALFESIYAEAGVAATEPAERIAGLFPGLPRTVIEELLRHARPDEMKALQLSHRLPLRLAEEARVYQQEVRLARAYEGLYLDSVVNPDSEKLALHLLPSLPGWSPKVRIDVRSGHFNGRLLDRLGPNDADICKVLVKQGERYDAWTIDGEQLQGGDTFYGAVLHALPDLQRTNLGFPSVGMGAAFEQWVRATMPMTRLELRDVLGMKVVKASAQSPLRLATGRIGYPLSGGGADAAQRWAIETRVKALYPGFTQEALSAFVAEHLQSDPLSVLTRLELEKNTLAEELSVWSEAVPAQHPATGEALGAEQQLVQRQSRKRLADTLNASWSRTLTTDNPYPVDLFIRTDVLGELPGLSADFGHVVELSITNTGLHLNGHGLLANFSGLKYLTLNGLALGRFPQELYQLRDLVYLTLNNCEIQLTQATAEGLSWMVDLRLLDLDDNPLGWPLDVSHMKNLTRLHVARTGLTATPYGLFDLEHVSLANLESNWITEVAEEFFEVDLEREAFYDFSDNPLTATCERRILAYIEQGGMDRKLEIGFDVDVDVDVDVNDVGEDIDSVDEDSGVESGSESANEEAEVGDAE